MSGGPAGSNRDILLRQQEGSMQSHMASRQKQNRLLSFSETGYVSLSRAAGWALRDY